jgi:predicted ATPase/class 3 adenylate cyclase/DNA-binding CsgD family transcriptional regulator
MRELPTGTVTLLFTDIEGSTRLLQQLGESYASLLETYRSLLRSAFLEFGGHEVDTQGDAFFVVFARASDAVSAAVTAQRALFTQTWPDDLTVRVRLGLHTGEPQLAAEGYVGMDIHRATRIMSAGHGGQVLLSQTTRDLVEQTLPEGVSLLDVGAHRLKDLQQPSQLFQLVIEGLPADFPPLKTLDTSLNNLPIQPTPFIGREKEVVTIQQLLLRQDVHLVTLTGPGGVGKTRLALQTAAELAEHFADGTWFVSLAPLSDPDLVIPTIVQTLNLREERERSLLEQLQAFLREKHILLLLDNFEQVISATTHITDLLGACPKLKVLITSREALHVRAEREFAVPTLVVPDPMHLPDLLALSQYEAVALFIERAQAVKADFQVTIANAGALAEICVHLDGLPLAIELAAARVKLLPPKALLKRLSHRLAVLTGGAQDLPARQQALRNTLQWSYDLLAAEEQRLFRWLSIFVGGCTLDAAEAVCQAVGENTPAVFEGVASLLDKSLLQQTERDGEEPRLAMLETLREFGLECLHRQGELEAARQEHARYYLALAEAAEPHFPGPEQLLWYHRLDQEMDNLRAIFQAATTGGARERKVALCLAAALWFFWIGRGQYLREVRTVLERLLADAGGIEAPMRLKALNTLALILWNQNDARGLKPVSDEALVLARAVGDQWNLSISLIMLGAALMLDKHDYAAAQECLEEAVKEARALEEHYLLVFSLGALGRLAWYQRDALRAIALYEEALVHAKAMGERLLKSLVMMALARAQLSQGHADRGRTLLEECLINYQALGNTLGVALALKHLGQLALQQGDLLQAEAFLKDSEQLASEIGDRANLAQSRLLLAGLLALRGEYAAARLRYEEGLATALELGHTNLIASGLKGLGCVAAAQGLHTWAAILWGTAKPLRESSSVAIPQELYDRKVAVVRSQLGEPAFEEAWARGRIMTPAQALTSPEAFAPQILQQAQAAPGSAPTPPTRLSCYPAGLTTREVEVLRLVAQGMTNEQVAEQIVVSPRTVSTHLTSIYNKLGVNSRSAATRFAVEHQLI